MGKRRVTRCTLVLIVVVTLLSASPILLLVSAADDPVPPIPELRGTAPATTDPTVTCYSDADADVCDNTPTQNTGASPYMYAGHDIDLGRFEAYIRFDLSAIPNDATVIAASFNAYVDGVSWVSSGGRARGTSILG